MTRTLFTTAALALAMAATPASAQLLGGGGGVGGMLGGGLGGGMGSGLGGTLRAPGPMIDATLRRSGAGEVRTERSVDRRSGRVRAGSNASGQGGSMLDGGLPIGSGSAQTSGSGSAGGSADAQLIGTDAVRSTARSAVGEARGLAARGRETVGSTRDAVGGARDAVGSAAGNAAGSANAMASGAGNVGNGMLALAGSAAANGAGSFDVAPGMNVVDAKGRAIGTVRSLTSEANGRVREVLVQVGDRVATLPATNFSGEGDVLVSAMGRGAVKREANEQ